MSKEQRGKKENQTKLYSLIAQFQWIKLGCLSKQELTFYEDSA